jgi:hypothetical protein
MHKGLIQAKSNQILRSWDDKKVAYAWDSSHIDLNPDKHTFVKFNKEKRD